MQSAPATTFDEAYYQRFYFDKKTRVVDRAHVDRLAAFVATYLGSSQNSENKAR